MIRIEILEGYEIDREKSTLTSIVFKPIKQIKIWEDLEKVEGYYITDYSIIKHTSSLSSKSNKNVFRAEKEAKSALAMAQISQLLPYYGGAITDEEWDIETEKFIIERFENRIRCDKAFSIYNFLAFHTRNQRDKFLKNNEQLVKDYLML